MRTWGMQHLSDKGRGGLFALHHFLEDRLLFVRGFCGFTQCFNQFLEGIAFFGAFRSTMKGIFGDNPGTA